MKISRYREYRPDLIMVGPQFQAKIAAFQFPTQSTLLYIFRFCQIVLKKKIEFTNEKA